MRTLFALIVVFAFAVVSPARAESIVYKADLAGASEVPPTDSKGSGTVQASYDTATRKLGWTVSYSGLTGPATAAHFHGPAAAGANAGPVITLDAAKLASPIKGEATLTEAQAADLGKGLWYLNVHTAAHPPGEIRGQLVKK
jgi:hypothetical protein